MELTVIQLPVCPAVQERSENNSPQTESTSRCIRSLSSESDSFVMIQPKSGLETSPKTWMSAVAIVMIVLQVASTAGLLLYLNMSMAQARNQGISDEVRCLGLLNALENEKEVPDGLVHHFGEPCIRLADSIKTYISKVTEKILSQHIFPGNVTPWEPEVQPRQKPHAGGSQRPSAHLTLRDSGLQGPTSLTPQRDLHVSCRHPVRSWGNQSFGSHLYNMTVSNGQLRIPQTGRYYLYTQVYFRYLTLSSGEQQSTLVVQCVYKKTAYPQPIQLLKGVGTKCWAPDSQNTLHSIYQGGMFELRAGDEIFVSVSSPEAVHAEDSSSYFGAFRFDP